jgi:predicted AAA+ superfamily ATPase
MPFRRAIVEELAAALEGKVPLLQVIVGPRHVGKTTAAEQSFPTADRAW